MLNYFKKLKIPEFCAQEGENPAYRGKIFRDAGIFSYDLPSKLQLFLTNLRIFIKIEVND